MGFRRKAGSPTQPPARLGDRRDPSTTLGAYLTDRAGRLKPATLTRRITAIAAAHRLKGFGFDTSDPARAATAMCSPTAASPAATSSRASGLAAPCRRYPISPRFGTLKAMLAKTKALKPVTAPSLLCCGLAAGLRGRGGSSEAAARAVEAVTGPNARSLEFRVAGAPTRHRDGLDEASDHAPLLRFLILVTAGSAAGRCFVLRFPAKGKSNAG